MDEIKKLEKLLETEPLFNVGDEVEMDCYTIGGAWTMQQKIAYRKLHNHQWYYLMENQFTGKWADLYFEVLKEDINEYYYNETQLRKSTTTFSNIFKQTYNKDK